MLVVYGDLHLSDSRPWSWEVSNKIVDFILDHPLNNETNTAIFLGDITEDAFLSGQVFDLMVKLFSQLKFFHTYVLVGNHDLKKNKQGQLTLSFKFLKRKMFEDRVTVIDEPYRFLNDGIKVLALPWKPDMKAYEEMNVSCDLLVGHFQDKTCNLPGETINIDCIKAKHICLGHIHDENLPNYIGSMVPNSIKGAGLPRFIRTYEKDRGESLVSIPHIMDYCFVTFPDPLPTVDTLTPVWTVYGCADESTAKAHYGDIAKAHYGDIYIKEAIFDVSMDKEAFKNFGSAGTKTVSIEDIYGEWEKTAQYDPSILKLAKGYFMSG